MTTDHAEKSPHICDKCGFTHHCICAATPQLESRLRLELLTHNTEFDRDTNTGKLLLHTLAHTRRHCWQRTEIPQALQTILQSEQAECVLVFPCEQARPPETWLQRHQTDRKNKTPSNDKNVHFIVLDATWQQARKMLRKSPWLQSLPCTQLTPSEKSAYRLRRNQVTDAICTCEVGIQLLECLGEQENADKLRDYFHLFMDVYSADKQGIKKAEFLKS